MKKKFSNLFNKYTFNIYYVPDTVLGADELAVEK